MIYGLSDLHLDITKEKDMGVFGDNWYNYEKRIKENWSQVVKDDDLVLVRGDISWAMTVREAYNDLKRLDNLPGKKVLIKGNHDYWWHSLKKINALNLKSLYFLQNDSYLFDSYTICGSRAWLNKDHSDFSENDEKIYRRELIRLDLSLSEGIKNNNDIIVMLHYPPFNKNLEGNDFHELMMEYGVKHCVYGHLHGDSLRDIKEGNVDGINYHCISADYLGFIPKKII